MECDTRGNAGDSSTARPKRHTPPLLGSQKV